MAKVKVTLFGLFRLDSGLHDVELEADTVRGLYAPVAAAARARKPDTTFHEKQLDGCMIVVNGAPGKERTKLRDGDEVFLLSPVAGG